MLIYLDGSFVRLKKNTLKGKETVASIKMDNYYWSTHVLLLGDDNEWKVRGNPNISS